MMICGNPITHLVQVEGKKKIGAVCDAHLIRCEDVCRDLGVSLIVTKIDSVQFCQLPARPQEVSRA